MNLDQAFLEKIKEAQSRLLDDLSLLYCWRHRHEGKPDGSHGRS